MSHHESGYLKLTDSQCDELRRAPGAFNEMLRKAHAIGYAQRQSQPVVDGHVEINADVLAQLWIAVSAIEAGDWGSALAAGAKAKRSIGNSRVISGT